MAPEPALIGKKGDRRRPHKEVGIVLPVDAKSNRTTLDSFVDDCLVPVLVEQFLREHGVDSGKTLNPGKVARSRLCPTKSKSS
jgi:hypothetical protein